VQDANFTQAQIKAIRRADVIFVAADGYTLAPSRVRAYSFAKACRDRGWNAEVVSFHDHLGAPGQGSSAYRMDDQTKLRLIALGADVLKLNPTAIFYMQKVSYHSLAVAIASSANGNPIVLDYDDFDFNANSLPMLSHFLPGVSQIGMTAELIKHAHLCVCSSYGLMDMVRPFNPKCEFIPTGTDLSVFDVGLRDRADRPAGDPVNMIWLGDLWDPQILKDVMVTVDAFAALPASIRDLARLTVVGFGDFWIDFQERIRSCYSHIPNIVMVERMAPADVPALMARSDIGLLPLADNNFSQCKSPTKMFEYMAMKVAVLGAPIGEVARIVKDGESGMLADDVSGYMRRMGALILDGDLRRSITERAYAEVLAGYHLGPMGDKLVELLLHVRDCPREVGLDRLITRT
jgi:glycosyltransferase involved in cell wall biosynthesis